MRTTFTDGYYSHFFCLPACSSRLLHSQYFLCASMFHTKLSTYRHIPTWILKLPIISLFREHIHRLQDTHQQSKRQGNTYITILSTCRDVAIGGLQLSSLQYCLLVQHTTSNILQYCLLVQYTTSNILQYCLLVQHTTSNILQYCLLVQYTTSNILQCCLLVQYTTSNILQYCLLVQYTTSKRLNGLKCNMMMCQNFHSWRAFQNLSSYSNLVHSNIL